MPANVAGKKTATIKRHDSKLLAIIIGEDTPPEYNTVKLLKRIGHNDMQQVRRSCKHSMREQQNPEHNPALVIKNAITP
jgi:hypothetical protein